MDYRDELRRDRHQALPQHADSLPQPRTVTPISRDETRTRRDPALYQGGQGRPGAYILCRNQAEAERERNERQTIIAGLAKQFARGDKALIGNSVYRRYLRRRPSGNGKPGPAFEIDPGKLAEEARYDGLFVLRTNAQITPLQAVLRYRDLWQVEDLFRRAAPRRSSAPARFIIPQTPPSVAMCSARSSP